MIVTINNDHGQSLYVVVGDRVTFCIDGGGEIKVSRDDARRMIRHLTEVLG